MCILCTKILPLKFLFRGVATTGLFRSRKPNQGVILRGFLRVLDTHPTPAKQCSDKKINETATALLDRCPKPRLPEVPTSTSRTTAARASGWHTSRILLAKGITAPRGDMSNDTPLRSSRTPHKSTVYHCILVYKIDYCLSGSLGSQADTKKVCKRNGEMACPPLTTVLGPLRARRNEGRMPGGQELWFTKKAQVRGQ